MVPARIEPGHKLDGLRYSPMVFQEGIRKQLELRITVIGNRMFAAAVDSEKPTAPISIGGP